MNDMYAALRGNVGMLGQLLGKTIKEHLGEEFLDKIENIRQLAKSSRQGNEEDRQKLITERDEKLKGILTADQMKKLKELEDEMRQKKPS